MSIAVRAERGRQLGATTEHIPKWICKGGATTLGASFCSNPFGLSVFGSMPSDNQLRSAGAFRQSRSDATHRRISRLGGTILLALATLIGTGPVNAQQPHHDSSTVRRARRPLLRWGEVIGVAATTGLALATDQKIRNLIHDPHDALGRSVSDFGNALGNGIVVYPSLLALAVGGKVFHQPGLYGVSSRALGSTLLGGAAAVVLKSIVGRNRPSTSPDDPYSFHPFRLKDQSFPSGHTIVAFALATSFARETKDQWSDVLFFTAAATTGYARLHDDKHWASDVVFGAGIGILCARFVHRFQAKVVVAPSAVGMHFSF